MTAETATRTRTVTLEPSVKGLAVSVDLIALVGPHAHPSEAALRRAGYAVRSVRSIAEALTTPLPQLIVVDILSDTADRIREACCRVPVIGVGPDSRLVEAYEWGVTDYQTPTIDGRELAARARRIITREKDGANLLGYILRSPTLSVWRRGPVIEWRGREIGLSRIHWQILKELARQCGSFRSVRALARASNEMATLDGLALTRVRIYYLRKKLTRITGIAQLDLIVHEIGHGYRLALPSLEA